MVSDIIVVVQNKKLPLEKKQKKNISSYKVNRVNLNPVNFGYLSTDDRLKVSDNKK